MFKKSLATAALAVIAIFAFAPAANAAGYVSDSLITVASTPVAGEATPVAFAAGAFTGGEDVRFSVTGDQAATLSVVKTAVTSSITKAASSTGAVSVTVTLPENATGVYTVTATGLTSNNIGTAALSVVPADSGTGNAVPSAGNALPSTGYNAPVLIIWGAAGILVLGVALVLVRISVRRQHAAA
ncbi:sortase [Cryobacterium sp. Y11]|uniref:sortase n=1 Tax=Cryobacterium sp. Y11 TaxID=2045016 RepID=UPI000CE3385D|nr:sortase [Cryobacterium sp. Y11]